MRYEWDEAKAESNRTKHGVDFADAVILFDDPSALTKLDGFSDEERYIIAGMASGGRLLVAVYTWKGDDTFRIISA